MTPERIFEIVLQFANEATPNSKAEPAAVFLRKMHFHALSVDLLGKAAPGHIDPFSVHALVRVVGDCVCPLMHLVDPDISFDEHVFRVTVWRLHGLLKRQSFDATSDERRAHKTKEQVTIEECRQRLRDNAVFCKLSQKQQRAILDGSMGDCLYIDGPEAKKAGFPRKMARLGFGKLYKDDTFYYQSGHIHAGYDAILQVDQARAKAELATLFGAAPDMLLVLLAHALRIAAGTCTEWASKMLELPPTEQAELDAYREVGRRASHPAVSA